MQLRENTLTETILLWNQPGDQDERGLMPFSPNFFVDYTYVTDSPLKKKIMLDHTCGLKRGFDKQFPPIIILNAEQRDPEYQVC